jgi:5-methylcytosine-specific restriction endonuclease McrA
MPAKIDLPEEEIVQKWLDDIHATTRTLGAEYGCSSPTIRLVLKKHLSQEKIDRTKRMKISTSAAARPDLKTEEHRANARYASSFRTPESRYQSIAIASAVSAEKRRGKEISQEIKDKMSQSHMGLHSREQHPNWRGGTSKICWRGQGWTSARRSARQRDNNCCQICHKTAQEQGRAMDVHHRISYFSFATTIEANDLSNLVCLCRSCHRKVENGTILCP